MSSDASAQGWLRRTFGAVRLRQFADELRHRLSFVPMVYVVSAVVLVHVLLWLDQGLGDQQLPDWLETTVDSARAVFAAIAGGLITSTTLLLTLMLVAVQLAGSQFSPRTLRDWLGDRTLQHAIGITLGTTVFCLLALRSTRDFGEDGTAVVPHVTVLVAVALGVVSLVAVVRAVDHLTHSVRVGTVAGRIAADTIDVLDRIDEIPSGQRPEILPSATARGGIDRGEIPSDACAIEAPTAGWIQQIDEHELAAALPSGSRADVPVSIGGFVPLHAPLVWVSPPLDEHSEHRGRILEAFAIGDGRTFQQDVEFGLVQLTDIAVRALSPGVNDPTTACDIMVHIGNVLLAVWEREESPTETRIDGRTISLVRPTHASYLQRAIGPIRRYGAGDPELMATLVRTLATVRDESVRRSLPGPIEPIESAIQEALESAETERWSPSERQRLSESAT